MKIAGFLKVILVIRQNRHPRERVCLSNTKLRVQSRRLRVKSRRLRVKSRHPRESGDLGHYIISSPGSLLSQGGRNKQSEEGTRLLLFLNLTSLGIFRAS